MTQNDHRTQPNRLSGGLIDQQKVLKFSFDGKIYRGHPGDTLASALLANNVRLMGRSFKYHRPRGVLTADSAEPNALVELRTGARQEPNTRATVAELFDGLEAKSQNASPSLRHDFMAVNDLLSSFFGAGFYYKTFMWPKSFWENLYEPTIRKAAGLGSISFKEDPDEYDKGFLHCDLLVIGSGPAGLAAALTAGRSGARVILADEDSLFGGRLNSETFPVDDKTGPEWVAGVMAELQSLPNVRCMSRTTVIGSFDHGIYGAVERCWDHVPVPPAGKPRQIFWRIYSRRALLCAGAIERPIAFENNDRPGIMLASALRSYVNRWAVTPAKRVAVFTNNDDGHKTALDLIAKGVTVAAVIDSRPDAPRIADCELIAGGQVVNTSGRRGLAFVEVRQASGHTRTVECGALGISDGWNANVHLSCHQNANPVWNDDIVTFVPAPNAPPGMLIAGAANGDFSTAAALKGGTDKAVAALGDLGIKANAIDLPETEDAPFNIKPLWYVKEGKGRAWLDQQNDVTVKDVKLAYQEGYKSVEHLKRYTTLGMATDQGKTANVSALAIMAELTGKTIPQTGTTGYRPPYTPVPFGTWGGRARGMDFHPIRETPSHKWAVEQGAVFTSAGNWQRAQWFAQPGETEWRETVDREVRAVRASVGINDVTTLGKVDVQGTDAAEFLNLVYCNAFAKLGINKVRYGLMLREDGMAMDDGTTARLSENHFVMTTTTAKALPVYQHMEFVRQCLYPDMDVQLISTTEAWAQYAVAGPNCRKLLQKIVDPEFDISNEAFPYMACGEITVCGGLRARLFRISFSGEHAYEIAVPTRYGDALMRRLREEGKEFNAITYGTEALGVMRIEKGHAAGNELNGVTTALNLGMAKMVSAKKDCIGWTLSKREGLVQDDALVLVGLKPLNPEQKVVAGGHLLTRDAPLDALHDEGYVTSACYSPTINSYIGLAFLKNGANRMGEIIRVVSQVTNQNIDAEVVSTVFVDPEGERLRA